MTDKNDESLPVSKGEPGFSGHQLSGLHGLQDVDVKITVEWGRSQITLKRRGKKRFVERNREGIWEVVGG